MAFILPCNAPSVAPSTKRQRVRCALTPPRAADAAWRRVATAGAAAALAAALLSPAPGGAYGLVNGRLEKCRGDDACISTSSVGNPSKFGAPWTWQTETSDASAAWQSLIAAVEANRDGGTIMEMEEGPKIAYLRAEFPSWPRGIDDVEFRMVKSDSIVTYRSSAREPVYVYPIQTPLNNDHNRARLLEIRTALGWEELTGF